jgi:hypothetical protein
LRDKLIKQYRDVCLSYTFPRPIPGYAVGVPYYGNFVHPGLNINHFQLPPLDWLEKIEKHSKDHRTGVACPTCFKRAGVSAEGLGDTEESAQLCNFEELAPIMSSTELELLLHFEKFTSQNLALCETLWPTVVLRSAWKVRFSLWNTRNSNG